MTKQMQQLFEKLYEEIEQEIRDEIEDEVRSDIEDETADTRRDLEREYIERDNTITILYTILRQYLPYEERTYLNSKYDLEIPTI